MHALHAVTAVTFPAGLSGSRRHSKSNSSGCDRTIRVVQQSPPSTPPAMLFERLRAELRARHYHAEVVGVWARGAHFWNRQASFGGFPISLDRHVFARLGSIACPVTALHAIFVDAEVELGRAAPSKGKPLA